MTFKSDLLAGKVAFVAGGSSGINLCIAQRLAEAGAKVGIMSRNAERVAAAVETITIGDRHAMAVPADVRDYSAVEEALNKVYKTYGEIDIVISGAAGNFVSSALAMSANAFKTVIDIDLLGTFNVFRASYAFLRKPGASLIAISAGQGSHAMMLQSHACAAKAGINMLTKCLAMEWGPAGVRVNAVSPGPTAGTEGMARLAASPEAEAALTAKIPLRRYGEKREIADMILFLATDNAAYVTGAIFDCDGGASLGDASGDALTVRPRDTAQTASSSAG